MKERFETAGRMIRERTRGCARSGLGCLVVVGAVATWVVLRLRRRDKIEEGSAPKGERGLVEHLGEADRERWSKEDAGEEADDLEGW